MGSAEACAGGVGGPSGGADGRILIPLGSPSTLQHPPAPPRRRPKAHAVKHPGWVGFSSLNRCGHFQHPRKKPSLSPKRGCTQTPSPDLAPPVKTPSPKAKQGVEEGKTRARLARVEGQATAPMGGDGQTDRPSRPSPWGRGRFTGGLRTHQTRAPRGRWPWRAAPGAAGPAASCGEGGRVGTGGRRVLCRGPPLWRGRCGREEQTLPYTGPGTPPALPSRPRRTHGRWSGVPGCERTPSSASFTPPTPPGIEDPKPQQTQAHSPVPNGKAFTSLGLDRSFSSLKIFSGVQPPSPVAAATAQVPDLSPKDTRSHQRP